MGFPCGSAGKESACSAGDLGLLPGLGWSPGEGKGYPLQYSGLENSMDCRVHGVANSWTRLRDFHFTKFSEFNCHGWLTQCPFWNVPTDLGTLVGAIWKGQVVGLCRRTGLLAWSPLHSLIPFQIRTRQKSTTLPPFPSPSLQSFSNGADFPRTQVVWVMGSRA